MKIHSLGFTGSEAIIALNNDGNHIICSFTDNTVMVWGSQHGTFEKYNSRGHHIGEFNLDGIQTKPANPSRFIEP
jgi:hypothetical protein